MLNVEKASKEMLENKKVYDFIYSNLKIKLEFLSNIDKLKKTYPDYVNLIDEELRKYDNNSHEAN